MDWQQFVMNLDYLNPDSVEEIFARHGAHSVTLTDSGDQPVLEPAPGETPLWTDTCITGLFSADADFNALTDDLIESLSLEQLPTHYIEALADREWTREWLKDFASMQFGERLWICPSGSSADNDDAVVVRLDPGLAFGTGTHPTTAMCLSWLDGLSHDGKTMLDYGCGSGVLAIAALKLGCTSATGMDIDPQALVATRSNAANNGVDLGLTVVGSDAEIRGKLAFDLVTQAGTHLDRAQSAAHVYARHILKRDINLSSGLQDETLGEQDLVLHLGARRDITYVAEKECRIQLEHIRG